MRIMLLLVLLSTTFAAVPHLTGDALVDYLNTHQSLWKAEAHQWSAEEMAAKAMKKKYLVPRETTPISPHIDWIKEVDIPSSFDAREHWYNCPTIGSVRDQAQCASCWAFSAAEIISDRICVASKGTKQPIIAPEDILACCQAWDKDCGGCDGGYPDMALNFYNTKGVVTGGGYGSKIGCSSYAFSPCGTHNGYYYGKCPSSVDTPACTMKCDAGYTSAYADDKYYGQPGYRVWNGTKGAQPSAIQREILAYGPVMTCFDMYSDLWNYKSGVYVQTAGYYVGGHCVKLLGWGVDNGTPYWIAANSWNSDWGENGFFRVLKGINEVNFENFIYAAVPKSVS